jgi:hypothetical protein
MEFIRKISNSLNNPYLVARVQKFFGINFIKVRDLTSSEKPESKPKSNHHEMPMDESHVCVYSVDIRFFYHFFMVITNLGNEIFYIFFLPVMMWNFHDKITFLTTISWAFNMYLGQATKDLIQLPRPATPPVVKLEYRFLKGSIMLFIIVNSSNLMDFLHSLLL